jgi:hypothetical protein
MTYRCGHPRSPENTNSKGDGKVRCRTCYKAMQRRLYANRRDGTKHRRDGLAPPDWTIPAAYVPIWVDRDPCPRCAVRGDIGCAHSRQRITMGAF